MEDIEKSSQITEEHKVYNTIEDILNRMQQIVGESVAVSRQELEGLKQSFYKIYKGKDTGAGSQEPGEDKTAPAETLSAETDPKSEELFKSLMHIIKEKRAAAQQALEAMQQENLKKKEEILNKLEALVERVESDPSAYNEFKALQTEWKEIREIPQSAIKDMWQRFQQFAERFYDIQKLNNEFREYDFKKNLEIKTRICEQAEELCSSEDILSAQRMLQKLHQDFRETGPVAKELREEIWNRFKAASASVNKRHQQYFDDLKQNEMENLSKKESLCTQMESIDFDKIKTIKQWNAKTDMVIALQKEWKEIGFASYKSNQKIFERFRKSCDLFFEKKAAFFGQLKDDMAVNLERKTALCEQAESLKDSTEWKETAEKLAALQKEWKEIGAVPRKYTVSIWNRFEAACDCFFERRSKENVSPRAQEAANLKQKKEILEQLRGFDADNLSDSDKIRIAELVQNWSAVGHVPYKLKDKMAENFKSECKRLSVLKNDGNIKETSSKDKLIRKYETLTSEIQTYENNLGFLSVSQSGKQGNKLVEGILNKIEELKKEAQNLLQLIHQQ